MLSLVFSRLRLRFLSFSSRRTLPPRIFPVWRSRIAPWSPSCCAWCFLCVAPLVPPTQVPRFGAINAVDVSVVFAERWCAVGFAHAALIRTTYAKTRDYGHDYAPVAGTVVGRFVARVAGPPACPLAFTSPRARLHV